MNLIRQGLESYQKAKGSTRHRDNKQSNCISEKTNNLESNQRHNVSLWMTRGNRYLLLTKDRVLKAAITLSKVLYKNLTRKV